MKANRRKLLLGALALAAVPAGAGRARQRRSGGYLDRDDVRAFVDEVAEAQALPRPWLEKVLASGRHSAAAERLMTPALTPPPRDWRRYRERVLDDSRLRDGRAFLQRHEAVLARAQEDFGVPPQIVAAIIGIETHYGRVMGTFRTLDVLLTLAFDYPRRAAFYRDELAQFLSLGHRGQLDVLRQTGSFAGAIGLPQFMPSSIARYGLDYDGDGRIDLARSEADAIGSVGRYLQQQGWQRDHPIAFDAVANEAIMDEVGRGIVAERTWTSVAELGVRIDGTLDPEARVVLMDLPYRLDDAAEGVVYRLGTVNMAAILHYNRSYFYGAAVTELAAELRGRDAPAAATASARS